MPYIDSMNYYQRRRQQQDFALLLRHYYTGRPYVDAPEEIYNNQGGALMLWQQFMGPSAQEEPVYLENSVRNKIDDIVTDVLPAGSHIVWEGLEDDTLRAAVLERLLNFTDDYPSGEAGLRDWLGNILTDIAQTGDGLAMLEGEGGDKDALVRLKFFPSEVWDMEMDVRHLPQFYRIEYLMKNDRAEDVVYRWDIYKDRIVEYSGKPDAQLGDSGAPPPDSRPLTSTGLVQSPVLYAKPVDEDAAAMMRDIGAWVVAPLRWQRLAADDERGTSEILMNDLSTTDDINRLLKYWKNGAINAGSAPLFIYDTELPPEPGGEQRELNASEVGPGGVLKVASADFDRAGRATYPENIPSIFPHKDVLDRFRVAVSGSSPLSNLDPQQISRFGELSGFSKSILEKVHTHRVNRIRDSVLQTRIAQLLQTGIVLLALKGAVPGLTEAVARGVRVRFEFGGQVMSPDEQLKIVTMVAMCQKLGLTPQELVAQLPFDLIDRDGTIQAMQDMMDQAQEMNEMLMNAKAAGPKEGGNGPKPADKRGG